MRRHIATTTLALLLAAACAEQPTSPDTSYQPDVVPAAAREKSKKKSAKPVDIAVIGDVPYGDAALVSFPSLLRAIGKDKEVRLAVHVGDIKSGSTECSDAWFEEIDHQFDKFKDPLIYSIGDNEWTDCHRANNGGYDPIDRLDKIREIFFKKPGTSLGRHSMKVDHHAALPEDQRWVEADVTFATFHVIGSNNGRDPWFDGAESPAQTAAREAEYAARNAANIAWLENAFATADAGESVGMVLFLHADLWHPDDRADGADFSAHTAFVRRLADLAAGFDGPILMVSGDSHNYRVDPGVPWFSLYGATPPANVTQVIVDRSIEDDIDWLRLHVDPNSPEVFSWEQVFVP